MSVSLVISFNMPRLIAALVASLALGSSGAFCQNADKPSQFEAVSIRPAKSSDFRAMMKPSPGGRLSVTNMNLKALIEWAYQVRDFQVSGEPAWVDTERFDIAAKSDGNPRYDFLKPELETMFQSVLADRFKLTVHKTTKELRVYSLVASKNGPKVHAVEEGNCPEVPPPDNPCRFLRPDRFARLNAQKAPMSALAFMLSLMSGKSVIDKTDLKGSYTYVLDWSKYIQPPQLPPGATAPPGAFDPASVEPAIATALEEQLGLKLQPGKGPVELLVIDHVEHPSPN
jgi:bla regulator protein blaR1